MGGDLVLRIDETPEMADWLKTPSEMAVVWGVSIEEAKRRILAGPDVPLKRRLQADPNFEEKLKKREQT